MLKSPVRKIGGCGSFVRYLDATAKEAWQLYGVNNGVDSEVELVAKISRFAQKRSKAYSPSDNPLIGCIELADVVTLDNDAFITPEQFGYSFPKQVVKLKYFHVQDAMALLFDHGKEASNPFSLVTGNAAKKPCDQKREKGAITVPIGYFEKLWASLLYFWRWNRRTSRSGAYSALY